MARYRLSPRAQEQMREIWNAIALHDEAAADRLLARLFDKFDHVARHPHMGPVRPEIGTDVRLVIEGNYIAIYEPAPYGAAIIAIVHGRRDPAHWLD